MNSTSSRRERIAVTAIKPAKKPEKEKRTYLAPDCVSAEHGQNSWLFCKHFFSLSLKIYLFTYSLRTSSVLQTIWFALPPRLALLSKNYSTSVRWIWDEVTNEARSAELAIIISYPTSASGIINCFIENAYKISRILHYFICKTTDFQLVCNFQQTRTVIIFREHGIMAHIPWWLGQSEV